MSTVQEHYDHLLAEHYSWMFGNFEKKVIQNEQFFKGKGLLPGTLKHAIDLGAGSGFQSIALARNGYNVTAFDTCQKLLDELNTRRGSLVITSIHENLLHFSNHLDNKVDLITCMGDTLTHLATLKEVEVVTREAYQSLVQDGYLVFTFRDLTYRLQETERFIPVKSDDSQIFTCFLEYEETHVKVHDLIYKKQGNRWDLRKSSYRKLIIPPDWLRSRLESEGFKITHYSSDRGMITLIGMR